MFVNCLADSNKIVKVKPQISLSSCTRHCEFA